MQFAAGYGRVSTQGQVQHGTSADEQRRKIEQACKEGGCKLYKIYSDDGFSGKSMKSRPAMQALIADAKAKKFGTIFFTSLDRLGRSLRELENIWDLFETELGLDIICIDEPAVNTKGKFGKVIRGILGAFAEWEKAVIKERTDSGRRKVWGEGKALIGAVPYGYKWDDEKKKIEVNKRQERVYNRIVSMYLEENFSIRDSANKLSRDGVLTPSSSREYKTGKARRWNTVTITKILKNPAYKGELFQSQRFFERGVSKKSGKEYMYAGKKEKPKNEWVSVKFPPLISEERWNAIQKKIEFNRHKPKRKFEGYGEHFLAENVLRCGECGAKMRKRVRMEKGRKPRLEYACYWKQATQKELEVCGKERCQLKAVPADRLDDQVFSHLVQLMAKPSLAKDYLKHEDFEEIKKKLASLEAQKQTLENNLQSAYNLITRTDDPEWKERYENSRRQDEKEYSAVKDDLARVKRDLDLIENEGNRLKAYEDAVKKVEGNFRKQVKLHSSAKGQFGNFLYALPASEKKRLIEAVVAPDQGGRCSVRYLYAADLAGEVDDYDPEGGPKGPFKDRDPIIEMEFYFDLDRVEKLINSLNRTELLKKFDSDPVSRLRENVDRWGWFHRG